MAVDFGQLKRLIQKHKLRPATQRCMSLFSLSAVGLGYTKLLRKQIKISYGAVAGKGRVNFWHSMYDEQKVINRTKKFAQKNFDKLTKMAFEPAERIFARCQNEILKHRRYISSRPEKFLKALTAQYPNFMAAIGIINCFWRFVGNNEKALPKYIKTISRNREKMAQFYPEIEKMLADAANNVGRRKKFSGDLLALLSVAEMKKFLDKERLSAGELNELNKRRNGFFYLFVERGERELIISNPAMVKKIDDEFFKIKEAPKLIKGYPACAGKAAGKVLLLENNTGKIAINNYILVASSTNPQLMEIVKNSAAVVTDEGGVLSHAAVLSRELGIPCVIGTKIATQVFKDGDMVEVDAEKGVVRKIN
ncbi:hypothetical protein EPN28_01660 [Patescibacteria group bacterium]|nr:MAG: hypothetical protein EPN28_01660 [Patescibacteria group bacterium]